VREIRTGFFRSQNGDGKVALGRHLYAIVTHGPARSS
jgi:hypothetical protein